MNLNKAYLIGRATSDPESYSTQTGKQVCTFNLATNRVWKDQKGEKVEETSFHKIVLWTKLAEIASKYVKKGTLLLIEGRIQNRSWEDKEGKKRYTTEIIAETMQLGPRASNLGEAAATTPYNKPKKQEMKQEEELPVIDEDEIDIKDIPF